MKLISVEDYDRLNKHQKTIPTDTYNNIFLSKDNIASDVLNTAAIPDEIRLQLYSSLMHTVKKTLAEILNKPLNVKIENSSPKKDSLSATKTSELPSNNFSASTSEDVINHDTNQSPDHSVLTQNDFLLISSLPSRYMLPASKIMTMLKDHEDLIQWDEEGHVTFFGNDIVPESNITDLLNYAVRESGFQNAPAATNRFLAVCKLINIPTHLLARNIGKDWYGNVQNIRKRKTFTDSAKNMERFYSKLRNWEPIAFEDILENNNEELLESQVQPSLIDTPSPSSKKPTKRKRIEFL